MTQTAKSSFEQCAFWLYFGVFRDKSDPLPDKKEKNDFICNTYGPISAPAKNPQCNYHQT